MKRLMALLLSLVLAVCCLSAFAEQGGTPPGDFGGSDGQGFPGGGTPPEMPQGQMPDGQVPEGFGESGGFPADGQMPAMPDGQMPEGFGESGGFPAGGGFPGGSGEKAEGQIGSWSLGGHDAGSIEGDDYAYDAALYITADGVDADKSAEGRVTGGTYDGQAASGVVIDDSAS